MRKRIVALPMLAALALVLSACGGTQAPENEIVSDADEVLTSDGLVIDGELIADKDTYEIAQTQTLQLYSTYQEAAETEYIAAFTRDTGIKVDLMRLVAPRLYERVLSEHGAGQLGADVIRSSDWAIVDGFDEAGIWEPYSAPGAEGLEEVVLRDGNFSRVAAVVQVLGYNTQLVTEAEAPKSWEDLLDPKWKGKIGISQGVSGGSNIAVNRFALSVLGDDYWTKLAAQEPIIFESAGQKATALARGEIAVATTGSAGVNVAVTADNAPVDYVVPTEGLVVFDYYLGMVASGKNKEAAEVFMNYNFSKRGQSVFPQIGDYAVRPDVAPPVSVGRALPTIDSDLVWRMPLSDVDKQDADIAAWKSAFNY